MKAQGFTLIELLAVIVILAIIALIATPIVLGIIDDTKESAQLRSAEMYLKGVANAVMRENMNSGGNFRPIECTITSEGNLDCDDKEGILEVEVDGEKPKNGKITFEEGKIKEVRLEYETATIVMDEDGSLVYSDEESISKITYESLGNYKHIDSNGMIEYHDTESGICSLCGENVLAPGLYKTDGTFVSWEQLTSKEYCTIPSSNCCYSDSAILNVDEDGALLSIGSYSQACCDESINEYMDGKLVVSNELTSIGTATFIDCTSLTSVTIPDSVTYIDYYSFYNCPGLISISIPNSVSTIGGSAFSGCSNLTTIDYMGTKTEWNNIYYPMSSWDDWRHGQITVHCTDGDIVIPAYS